MAGSVGKFFEKEGCSLTRENLSFTRALQNYARRGLVPVIPDLKCRSPKAGDLLQGRDPVVLAGQYEAMGAPVLSVVTEQRYFGGGGDLLRAITGTVSVPVLRKDFLTSEEAIQESKELGASAVLLIAAMLSFGKLMELFALTHQLEMEALIEVHNETELENSLLLSPQLLGINNRKILDLERDDGTVSLTEMLAPLVPPGIFLVSESGMVGAADVRRAINAGAGAVLIGTALLQAADPQVVYAVLTRCRLAEN
jgi:indole-3-glycerol phosphate synthase